MHTSRGACGRAGRPASRRGGILTALILALAFGSIGQAVPVPRGPGQPGRVGFEVWAFPEKPPALCVHQKLTIYVSIHKHITKTINGTDLICPGAASWRGDGHQFHDCEIGKLGPSEFPGGTDGGERYARPAQFLFTGEKPGDTTLIFKTAVNPKWVKADSESELAQLGSNIPAKEARVPVKVVNCKFKATTIGDGVSRARQSLHFGDQQ